MSVPYMHSEASIVAKIRTLLIPGSSSSRRRRKKGSAEMRTRNLEDSVNALAKPAWTWSASATFNPFLLAAAQRSFKVRDIFLGRPD